MKKKKTKDSYHNQKQLVAKQSKKKKEKYIYIYIYSTSSFLNTSISILNKVNKPFPLKTIKS